MSVQSNCVVAAAGALAGAGILAVFGFGPLDPPNGPIAPTYKTLSEVEPRTAINADNTPGDADSVYRIVAPGSYYLTAGFSVPSGKNGIEIASSNITVDLNGFRISGQGGSLDGIHVNGALFSITIRNGALFQPQGDGVDAADASASRIERVTVTSGVGQGIIVGDGDDVANCTVQNCGSHGINAGDACRVTDCTVRNNGGIGIDVDNDSVVRDCIATGNASDGIAANDACTVSGCTASANTANGINASGACIVSGSAGRANGGIGIDVDSVAIVTDCTARDNTGDGISANNGSVITTSTAALNQTGIAAGIAASISGCNAYGNRADGIEFGTCGDIRANNASSNLSGAGLRASGNLSRVDLNESTANKLGIALDGAECLILRNLLWGNGALVTGQGNDYLNWAGFAPWDNIWSE